MAKSLVCMLAAVAVLAACGGNLAPSARATSPWASSTVFTTSQPAGSIRVLMANLRFTPSDLHVKAGKVVFFLVVPGSETVAHNMVIEDQNGNFLATSATVKPAQSAVFTISNPPAGNYKFISTLDLNGYSDVEQAQMGMVGTLEVTPSSLASSTVFASSPPAGSIRVLMANYRFTPSDLHAKAGKVVFFLVAPGTETLPHNMVIEDQSGSPLTESATIQPNQDAVFTVDNVPAANYKIISSLDGVGDSVESNQAEMGMVGTLEITP